MNHKILEYMSSCQDYSELDESGKMNGQMVNSAVLGLQCRVFYISCPMNGIGELNTDNKRDSDTNQDGTGNCAHISVMIVHSTICRNYVQIC
jgi:hypothetical protein